MELGLAQKQVLVTGGTRGIGLAIARTFAGEGAAVHVFARNEPSENPGERIEFYSCDITDAKSVHAACEKLFANTGGKLDVLICNAGNGSGSREAIQDEKEWAASWNLNFNGVLNVIRATEEKLRHSGGNIVCISSIAGREYVGAPTVYSTAKAALNALAKNLSFKMAPEVRVNVVCPGNVYFKGGTWEKKMNDNEARVKEMLAEKVPLKRFGTPDEIANLVVFIASPAASFITGACMVADGGQSTDI